MSWTLAKKSLQAIGPYDLLGKIADGGMSSIYKGRHRDSGELVAIKVVKPELARNPALLKRFEQEYRVAHTLGHPHIVRGLDFGKQNGLVYLVLEYVEGESLGDRLERTGPLAEEEAIRLIVQVAEALHEAHRRGIVHRDVKPDNIMITTDGQAKLTDLGLVKDAQLDLDLTRADSGLGTPNFMAPEQFDDAKHADARCDIYSLGATLYMAVTGKLPFEARGGYLPVLKKKLANQLVPARQLVPTLSATTDAAIQRAMSFQPEERQASCASLIAQLTQRKSLPATKRPVLAQPAKPGGPERRVAVRYISNLDSACRPLGGSIDRDWRGTIRDISVTGVCLLLERRFEPQTVLTVDLSGSGDRDAPRLLARVVRVKPQPPGKWIVGCTFGLRLTEEELNTLVGEGEDTV